MGGVSASKTWKVLPALVACLIAVASVVCLVHTDVLEEAQTAPQGQHHTSSSSSVHITLDPLCLVAIPPAVLVLIWLCLGALCLSVLLSNPVVPAFPLFIPPKAVARS